MWLVLGRCGQVLGKQLTVLQHGRLWLWCRTVCCAATPLGSAVTVAHEMRLKLMKYYLMNVYGKRKSKAEAQRPSIAEQASLRRTDSVRRPRQ